MKPTRTTMKYWSLLWLSAMLAATEAGRSRFVPNSESDHRELQSNNVRVTGRAYECTENDFEIPEAEVRDYKPGTVVKICIKPDVPSENRGIVMRSIDEMNLKGEGYGKTQPVIEEKREKFTTLALCIPGQLVCSFKTKLSENLFWSPDGDTTNITGVAMVSMEYIDESFALNGLAGTAIAVGVRFAVKTVAPPPGVSPDTGVDEDSTWWTRSPLWFRVFIIIFLLLIICCCCALCLTIPCVAKEMIAEDKEREARRELVEERKQRTSTAYQSQPQSPRRSTESQSPRRSTTSQSPRRSTASQPQSQRSSRPFQEQPREQPQSSRSSRSSQY